MIEYFLMAFFAAGGPGKSGAAVAPDAGTPAAATAPVSPTEFKNPVEITADRFEIQGKRQEAVWIGHVKAVRGQTVLTCDRLLAHYTKAQEITRIECIGRVEATHKDMWAGGERADFDNVAGILVVTGNPEARKGQNRMKGAKIVFDVARDVISVEGGAQTIFESGATRPIPKLGGRK
ncbi:MAG: hypothetical protein IRZ16_03965 [Myxococcaceae bacterium]|nr:hypothetical protein [Myxococcaceae bacterium]